MQIDLITLFSKLSPPSGGTAPLAAKGTEGGFLAAILEMAGEMGLPPGELANLAAAPDGGALLERLARLANGEETAAPPIAFLTEIPEGGEITALLPEDPAVSEETPPEAVQETELKTDVEAAPELPEDSSTGDLLPPVSPPPAETPPPGPVLQVGGEPTALNPAEAAALETDAVDSVNLQPRPAAGLESSSVRPANLSAAAPSSPALPAAPEAAEVLAQVGDRVRMILREGRSEIRMSLEPPELGSVRVHIASEHGHVTVRMIAEVPAVRDVLENGLTQLRAGLENGGLEVDGFEVLVSGNGAGHSDGFGGFDQGNWPEADDRPADGEGAEIEPAPSTPRQIRTARPGGIDYFA